MKVIGPVGEEESLFCRHIRDLILISRKNYCTKYSYFLTEKEQQLALNEANVSGAECSFFGGYDEASRKMFSTNTSSSEEFPLTAITFFYRKQDVLNHRSFLGSLMSLGINRNSVGDIKVGSGAAVVFVSNSVSDIILNEVNKIGNVGVRSVEGIQTDIPKQEFEELLLTVSSLRSDAVVSAACKLSREKSADTIKSGSVVLCEFPLLNTSQIIKTGDIFSVKGYGKFVLSEIGNTSKKGKIHIKVKKYK